MGPGACLSDINGHDHGSRNSPPTVKRVMVGKLSGPRSGLSDINYSSERLPRAFKPGLTVLRGSREPLNPGITVRRLPRALNPGIITVMRLPRAFKPGNNHRYEAPESLFLTRVNTVNRLPRASLTRYTPWVYPRWYISRYTPWVYLGGTYPAICLPVCIGWYIPGYMPPCVCNGVHTRLYASPCVYNGVYPAICLPVCV